MSSVAGLDTRAPYRGLVQQGSGTTTFVNSQTGSPSLTLFRRNVQELIRGHHRDREALREKVVHRLRGARDPIGFLNQLLDQCIAEGGGDGLDVAIDVLSQFGEFTLQYAREFWKKDYDRWRRREGPPRHHFNDDAWYVLLRATARSNLDPWLKKQLLRYCATDGTESIREAGIRAIGDLGESDALRLLHSVKDRETSPSVVRAIAEVLDDLED